MSDEFVKKTGEPLN